ncbi:hypothetical protein NDU88_005329 [Pleurodeles waltl]|uniref:Uncharacterized protein n=1 Tax=Pleurodeles waltl TaxID=8319 RepID=A0AAV7RMZ9_PLEWA|nr:hypothetical protein NDU88_005329 [Pleurodeles waltl]
METRTDVLQTEVKAAIKQSAVQELQISDFQWKLEDSENRQRRNNLLILGIAEDSVQDDVRTLVKKWERRIGASEAMVRESLDMAQSVLL